MGLGWGGVLYGANVLQGLVFLATAIALAVGRRLVVLLVPVLSLALAAGLVEADAALTERACSPAARAAASKIGLPDEAGETFVLSFPDSCSALFTASRPPDVAVADYRRRALEAGWEETATDGGDAVEVSNDEWTVRVEPYRQEDGLLLLDVRRRDG